MYHNILLSDINIILRYYLYPSHTYSETTELIEPY